jgi:hypothetical protein
MKSNNILTSLVLTLLFGMVTAQSIDVKWSDMQLYDNKKDGFFSNFIGGNTKYLYAKNTNLSMNGRNSRVLMFAYDNNTMEKVAELSVYNKKNEADRKKYDDLNYYKTLIFENILYVFWTKENKEKDELYVESFDAKLKPLNKLKKIYELNSGRKAAKKAELFAMGNKNNGETLLIGGELSGDKGQNVKVEYKVLKSDFSFAASGQQTLPAIISSKFDALSSSYEYGDDGNLHIKTRVIIPPDERKSLKKNESYYYTIYSIVDVNQNTMKSYPLRFENKNIFSMGFLSQKDADKVFGFFCDLTKDPKGHDTHGIFYCIINPQTKELEKLNFTYFTKAQLDKLFYKDEQDRKDGAALSSKKKKKSEEESLNSLYEIEQVKSIDKDNIVIFCSMMWNYSRTYCDSKGNCRTVYYCNKRNVTGFKLNNVGEIVWASNLDRDITYTGRWNVMDVSVICPDNKTFYVTYGSAFSSKKQKKNLASRKSTKQMRETIEYAAFEYSNGNFRKEEYTLNESGTKSKERKTVSPDDIIPIDNKFYVNSTRIQFKPWWYPTCICFPIILMNGNSRRGTGYLGVISFGK